MLYECYLDDSKDKHLEYVYVCAGFYGTRDAWKGFDKEWRSQLKKEGIRYFKTSEFKTLSGEFRKFRVLDPPYGRQAANAVRDRLVSVISNAKRLRGIGTVVPVADMTEVRQHEGAEILLSSDLYHQAFDSTLIKATDHACSKRDQIKFIHDQGDDFPKLFELYQAFRIVNPKTSKRIVDLVAMDDHTTPGLQIADMLANSAMKESREFYMGNAADSNAIFMSNRSTFYEYRKEIAEMVLVDNMERLHLPVPRSLELAAQNLRKLRPTVSDSIC